MKKQAIFLGLLFTLIVQSWGQINSSEGDRLSKDEQQMLSQVSANISSLNLGENIRNDIVWRKNWIEKLKETEETFYKIIDNAHPPYKLFYSTVIETKNINYQTETADLSIPIHILANLEWFKAMRQSLKVAQAVMDGLNATNRKNDWGLNGWPKQGVSNTNPFANISVLGYSGYIAKAYNLSVEFELIDQKDRVISKQVAELRPFFSFDNGFFIKFNPKTSYTLTFNAVNANDISDSLTIRLVSINGEPPETARVPITAISTKEPPQNPIKRITFTDSRDGKKYKAVEIGFQVWMAENLNFNAHSSKCYDNKPANCQKYGRLYDWNTATKVCPKGWHLPSDAEWQTLMDFAGGIKIAGKALKASSGWNSNDNGTDEFGFSALPGGEGNYNIGNYGRYWSSSENGTSCSCCFCLSYDYGGIRWSIPSGYYKYSSYSVRCLQD